ncbi:glycosyltransferase family 2 protein [Flavobacterium hibisci]|uniref:glycosyltransferase family 2 protein n=1 Tax=Flavobacterium hibisci TaxID=1914462 RepID=UPI001CC1BCAB|nr:glycosyltransferase [Flavobacterium hibisci]MBZ4042527.1 glycosyltransferase [Flavobacterium hibisci]
MLSILIPTYNYNVYNLVLELHKQCMELGIIFEIIVIDDGSNSQTNETNNHINLLKNSTFIPLNKNIGLSSNRNLLASNTNYENLLFIDGDSVIINPNYIKNYINAIQDFDIIYGGRVHPETVDYSKQKLRWKYGRMVEDKTALQRNSALYKTLMFNNTLIKKSRFNEIKFDSNLIKYGHEDTLFAYQVSLLQFKVKHIDNAIEHGHIDESKVFISKIKNGLDNLISIDESNKIDPDFVKILKLYHFLKKYNLNFALNVFYKLLNKIIHRQLISKNPSLFLFNLYRIGYVCTLKK